MYNWFPKGEKEEYMARRSKRRGRIRISDQSYERHKLIDSQKLSDLQTHRDLSPISLK